MLWSMKRFECRHDPAVVGRLSLDLPLFDQRYFAMSVLDLPIKFPQTTWRIPDYLGRVRAFVDAVTEVVKPKAYLQRYAYLTVHQGLVKAGSTHRSSGYHVDGLQGSRIDPKVQSDFSFVVSDCLPTVFLKQIFPVFLLNLGHDNIFKAFDRWADSSKEWRPEPGDVVACDAFTVHRADIAKVDCIRTFCRLSFSVREFDRKGNSINPLFNYDWKFVSRQTPLGLC